LEIFLLILFCAFIVGSVVGSFLNVVIYRLPVSLFADWHQQAREFLIERGELEPTENTETQKKFNIAFPASHCPVCKANVKAIHNIPILSYVLLRGRCNNCSVKISPRYPIVETVTGLLTTFVVAKLGVTLEAGLLCIMTWCLISLTMIDIDHTLLPDHITLPLMWIGLLANTFGAFTDLKSAVLGTVVGYLSLWSIYWLFKLLRNKEGMGYGDFKLLAALGAWMGWQALPMIIILSSLVGAIIGIGGILILGKDKNKPIPFGPYLAIAGWIAFFWGDALMTSYLQFSHIG